jgi:hypothetical protein
LYILRLKKNFIQEVKQSYLEKINVIKKSKLLPIRTNFQNRTLERSTMEKRNKESREQENKEIRQKEKNNNNAPLTQNNVLQLLFKMLKITHSYVLYSLLLRMVLK